ncbi:MAG: Polysaccharide transporter permease protein [Frankiales bacterium]|nr:Polysaccharide transporter permease protein [Frankiales bacterium]
MTTPEFIAEGGVWRSVGARSRLRQAWPLLVVWARREFRVRYRQSALGGLWAIVQPALTLAIYGGLLHGALKVGSEGLPYLAWAWAGLALWSFMVNSLTSASSSLINSAGITGKVYFPREIVPLAPVGACSIDLLIGFCGTVVLLIVQGVGLSWHVVLLPVVLVPLFLWTAALGILMATLTVFIRDLRMVIPFVLQMMFLASPIVYPPSVLPRSVHWVLAVNPVAAVVTAARDLLLRHELPQNPLVLLAQTGAGLTALILVLAYLRSVEPRLADVL